MVKKMTAKTKKRARSAPATGVAFTVDELADETLPVDTIGGICQRIKAITKSRTQCPSVWASKSGNITFCTQDDGHEGEHVGFRKRWPNEKEGTQS